jgi:hypothetical protein
LIVTIALKELQLRQICELYSIPILFIQYRLDTRNEKYA